MAWLPERQESCDGEGEISTKEVYVTDLRFKIA